MIILFGDGKKLGKVVCSKCLICLVVVRRLIHGSWCFVVNQATDKKIMKLNEISEALFLKELMMLSKRECGIDLVKKKLVMEGYKI